MLPFYIRRGEQAVGAEDTQVNFVARQYTPGKSTVYGSQKKENAINKNVVLIEKTYKTPNDHDFFFLLLN